MFVVPFGNMFWLLTYVVILAAVIHMWTEQNNGFIALIIAPEMIAAAGQSCTGSPA